MQGNVHPVHSSLLMTPRHRPAVQATEESVEPEESFPAQQNLAADREQAVDHAGHIYSEAACPEAVEAGVAGLARCGLPTSDRNADISGVRASCHGT
jgi:hypothetical protein